MEEELIVNEKKYWEDKYWKLYYKIEEELKELRKFDIKRKGGVKCKT